MDMKLSMILDTGIKNVELISDGEFNSFALTNGKLKKDNKLIVYICSDDYISHLFNNTEIKCVLCSGDIYEKIKARKNDTISKLGIVITDNPRTSFFLFHNYLYKHTNFYKNDFEKKIYDTAQIHSTCILPEKNIVIGKNVVLRSNVVLYENVWIDDDVTIGDCSVIGSPAFYYFDTDGKRELVDSAGGVRINKNVEIHRHVVISKGTLGGMTEIGYNSKIDSHVFVGHDVTIKENCIIPGGSLFGGGVTINENCFVGMGSKITPQISIGKNVMISAGSTVVKNVKDNSHVSGNFAIDHVKYVNFIRKISSGKI
jgi:UDP-3-O-[3-hydroxymyristoyl] glucosamine N-acyltransferase